ncbi:MAG: hypothetical protein ACRCXB_28365 [Aeromonadaceae bacterium]
MLLKINAAAYNVRYVLEHTTIPAVHTGDALIVPAEHAAACQYLACGEIVGVTHDDVERYERERP